MPPKEYKQGQLFFGNDETGFRPLGDLIYEELDGNCDTTDDIPIPNIGGSYEFTAEIQLPERMTVGDVILGLCGFDVEKLKQNNWCKMHGMIMHRRKHGKSKA